MVLMFASMIPIYGGAVRKRVRLHSHSSLRGRYPRVVVVFGVADVAYDLGTVAKMTDHFLHADAHPSGTTSDGRKRMSFHLKSSTTLAFYCVSLVIVQKSTPRVIDTIYCQQDTWAVKAETLQRG
jgi:hypothetical protein